MLFFEDFLVEQDIKFEIPKDQFDENYSDCDLVYWIERNNRDIYNQYAEYLYKKIEDYNLPIDDSDYPAWSYFRDPVLIKNQWLIHFTNDSFSIEKNGFTKGVDNISKLGLTTSLGEFDKKYGGYNFSYTINDFIRYYKGHSGSRNTKLGKYGDEAVLFTASGVKLWHVSDEEPQVIFYGNTAKHINAISAGENKEYAIKSKLTGKSLFENDSFEDVVHWFVRNYDQYRKHLN